MPEAKLAPRERMLGLFRRWGTRPGADSWFHSSMLEEGNMWLQQFGRKAGGGGGGIEIEVDSGITVDVLTR